MDLNRTTTRATAVVLGALALLAPLLGTPAHAGERLFTDPDDELGADIRRVRVANDSEGLMVRVKMDRIVTDGLSRTQALSLFVDTDAADPGPEYVLATGLNRGTDWSLRRVSTWGSPGRTVDCPHEVGINWRTERVRITVDRSCLAKAGSVRVALKAGEWTQADGQRTDWLGGRRTFSARVPLN